MNNKSLILVTLILTLLNNTFAARQSSSSDVFSPYAAIALENMVDDLYQKAQTDVNKAKQAMILLEAIKDLNPRSESLIPDTLRFAVLFPDDEYRSELDEAFYEYLDEKADLEVLGSVVSYGLDQLNSREKREEYLDTLLRKIGKKNPAFSSQVNTQLAMLDLEKGDSEAAKTRLIQAYDAYPYNTLAYQKLEELFAASDLSFAPAIYLSELRRKMVLNPAGIGNALAFGDYAQQLGLYDTAASSYEYAAKLYTFMYPADNLPSSIYIPWATACYNTGHQKMKCFEIAQMIRDSGTFDLVLEGLAGRLALKTGEFQQSRQVLVAAQKAETLLSTGTGNSSVTPEQLAWFYTFVSPDFEKALAWANRAYSDNPKSEQVQSLLGYAFVMNGNQDLSMDLVKDLTDKHQIAAIAMGIIKMDSGDRDAAMELFKKAVSMDPSSLAAESAIARIEGLGSEYIPLVVPESTLEELEDSFGDSAQPKFTDLNKIVELKLGIPGMELRYGNELKGNVSITNRSAQPVVISDASFIKGNIRIDAQVRGDINVYIPRLIELKIQPSNPLDTNMYVLAPVNLMTGRLRDVLTRHPQAKLMVDFTVYLDPVTNEEGDVRNAVAFIKPETNTLSRKNVNILRESLITQLNYISSGQIKQRINGINLFAGFLKEHYDVQQTGGLEYSPIPIELPLLTSALRKGLNDEDWTVRFYTMYEFVQMRQKLEFSFVRRVSELLSTSDYWPERLMALYLLSITQGPEFTPVIDWVAQNDSEQILRDFAQTVHILTLQKPALNTDQADTVDPIIDEKAQELVDILMEP